MVSQTEGVAIEVVGREQFRTLWSRLRTADARVRDEFVQTIRDITSPLAAEVRQAAATRLPHRGGLAGRITTSTFSYQQSGLDFHFRMSNQYSLVSLNRGRIKHPVYGNMNVWVFQNVVPRFWSDPVGRRIKTLQRELEGRMDRLARQIENG